MPPNNKIENLSTTELRPCAFKSMPPTIGSNRSGCVNKGEKNTQKYDTSRILKTSNLDSYKFASDECDGGKSGMQGNSSSQETGNNDGGCSSGSSGREERSSKPPGRGKNPCVYREEDMKMEAMRLKTYRKRWPHGFLPPRSMAETGFYLLHDDLVRCAFCRIEVGKWEEGDIPKKEHRRWSGNCPFIRGVACGNIPISDADASSSDSEGCVEEDSTNISFDTCGIREELRPFSYSDNEISVPRQGCIKSNLSRSEESGEKELSSSVLEKLGVRDMRAPVHPEYCTEAARLGTYHLWPLAIKQRPKDLADAGFYYTGKGDQTICFHCGGGLKDWEEGDDPWIEHALWFSKCHYLNLVKGNDFVVRVTQTRSAIIASQEVKNLENSCTTSPIQNTGSCSSSVGVLDESSSSSKTLADDTAEKKTVDKEPKDEARLCKICYSAELGVVFLPCGHMVACVTCAPSLSACPVCRQPFTHTVRAFLS